MAEKWRCRGKDGKFLGEKTRWSADYDAQACSTSSLPILCGSETVALAVNIDKSWTDNTVEERGDLIVKAVNYHDALVKALTELTEMVRAYELHREIDVGCDGNGPYEEAVKLLKKITKHQYPTRYSDNA